MSPLLQYEILNHCHVGTHPIFTKVIHIMGYVKLRTHYEEHESAGTPGQSNKVAVTAKEEAAQDSEDHPTPERGNSLAPSGPNVCHSELQNHLCTPFQKSHMSMCIKTELTWRCFKPYPTYLYPL